MNKLFASLVLMTTCCIPAPMSAASVNYQENQQLEIDRSANKDHYNLIAGYYGGGYRGGYYGGGYRGGYYGGGYRGGYYGGGYRGGYIYNPRGWNYWGWHGGSPWYPNYGYWGGGFWGAFAIGAVTGAIVTAAASQPQYYIVQSGTPGYTLLTNYGLTQVICGVTNLVVINGPSGGVICAIPTNTIPAGSYMVEPSNLTLIPRY